MVFKKQIRLLAILSGFLILVTASAYFFSGVDLKKRLNNSPKGADGGQSVIALTDMFYQKENFNEAIRFAADVKMRRDIKMIIVPHHLVPARYAAEAFKTAAGRAPEQLVVIGPNHENIGRHSLATLNGLWQTPGGDLPADRQLVDRLCADFQLSQAAEVFNNEHSVGALAPLIKYYWPDSQILPVVLDSYTTIKQVDELVVWLEKNLSPEALVIFSLDFSHYLSKDEAAEKDQVTRQLIEAGNVEKIMNLNNDYVDSPAGLAAAVLLAKRQRLKTEILRNANSFDFLSEKSSETTSYFTILFSEQ